MYTRWQASWRSGLGLGVTIVGAALFLSGPFAAESALQRSLLMLAVIVGAAVYTLVVIVSFRFGLHFSGHSRVGLNVVLVAPILYLVALAAIAFVRIRTHAQLVEMVTARDALFHNVVVPGVVFFLTFLLLPALIAYATARIIGGRRRAA